MSGLAAAKSAPQRVVLDGTYARLEPLAQHHVQGLWQAVVPERFAFLLGPPPATEAELAQWVTHSAASDDPLYFSVIDKATGLAEGRQALMRIVPEHGVIEIGGIYWGPRIARTRVTTEAVLLSAQYVFEELGYRRFEWKCNDRNVASKSAAVRFGFTFEGTFRQHMIVKGENRDTAWFAMLDGDWPKLKAGYERWLDPSNFEADGTQKTKLRF